MASSNGSRSTLLELPYILVALILCCLLSACDHPDTRPVDMGKGASLSTGSGWLLPAGSYHMVTTRPSPADENQQVLCTEPSPDWAVAFGEALQLSAEGKAPSGIGASLSGSSSDTETVTALVGRTAGVVALRDGLYAACQAYANHIIGKDAYAIIISQYGDLLVALAGASAADASAAGASGSKPSAAPAATPAGVAVAVSTGGALEAPAAAAKAPAAPAAGDAQVALVQQEALQALLTVCITDADPTENKQGGTGSEQNTLLTGQLIDPKTGRSNDYCDQLMGAVLAAAPQLLKPQSNGSGDSNNGAGAGGKAVAAADPVIANLQEQLIKGGARIKPDGVWGPQTEAALKAYLASHPGGLPA